LKDFKTHLDVARGGLLNNYGISDTRKSGTDTKIHTENVNYFFLNRIHLLEPQSYNI